MKKVYALLASLVIAVSGILLFNFMNSTLHAASLPRDCNNNSIIYCGAITPDELAQKYIANATGDLPAIYSDFGLSSNDMTHAGVTAKMGEVNKDGTVVVNGQVVATDAFSIGRQRIAGSTVKVIAGRTYYQSPPSTSFLSQSIAAYVFFDASGNFKAFVLTSCGNAGTATPKPQPKPPIYTCDSLVPTKLSRTDYSFEAHASADNGAVITGYMFDFGDGQTATTTSATKIHTYAQPGTYTAKVTVSFSVNGGAQQVTSENCQAQIVIETPPPTPTYTCDSLAPTQIDRTNYSFTGSATAEGGATIKNYIFDFGDGTTPQTVTSPIDVRHNFTKSGPYTVTLTVTVTVNEKDTTVTSDNCVAHITIAQQECLPGIPVGSPSCTPAAPTELPHTGPTDLIFGGIGLSSIVAAAYYWYTSRRGLLSVLMNR